MSIIHSKEIVKLVLQLSNIIPGVEKKNPRFEFKLSSMNLQFFLQDISPRKRLPLEMLFLESKLFYEALYLREIS